MTSISLDIQYTRTFLLSPLCTQFSCYASSPLPLPSTLLLLMTGQFIGTISTTKVIKVEGTFYLLCIYSSRHLSRGLLLSRSYLTELEVHQFEMPRDPFKRCFEPVQFCSHENQKKGLDHCHIQLNCIQTYPS